MPTPKDSQAERTRRRQIRLAAIVMAATMVLWMGAQFAGGALGLPARFVFLFDFAAIGGLVWALSVTYFVWRARRAENDDA